MSVKSWSEEEEQELIDMYKNETKDIQELCEHFGKGHRSVISKLVQLKIYEKPDTKHENKTQKVKAMLRTLERLLEIQIDGTNLNKKSNLVMLVEAVERVVKERDK